MFVYYKDIHYIATDRGEAALALAAKKKADQIETNSDSSCEYHQAWYVYVMSDYFFQCMNWFEYARDNLPVIQIMSFQQN